MDYYIQGDAARAEEIKAAFERLGINTASNSFTNNYYLYYSSNGLVYIEEFYDSLLNVFKSNPHYKELELTVKPMFKVGEWITDGTCKVKITAIDDTYYWYSKSCIIGEIESIDKKYHLWSIEDAKDGDVLACGDWLFILKQFNVKGNNHKTYCHYDLALNRFKDDIDSYMVSGSDEYHPAAKEQRDLLFAKMKEAGYEWDEKKKELKKITVKPMFKVGDWVVSTGEPSLTYRILESNVTNELGELDYKVEIYSNGIYEKTCFIASNKMDEWGHLWTIQDAKDGDVLVDTLSGTRALTILFISINEDDSISAYCGWNGYTFRVTIDGLGYGTLSSTRYVPATKEQRDLFFTKMREAGYQWDSEKKELRKIKPHYDIKNFKPFDKVLVRCSNDEEWMIEFYCKYDTLVHTSPHRDYPFMGIGDSYSQCIPFEGNEHLLGTTTMCDEQYVNW